MNQFNNRLRGINGSCYKYFLTYFDATKQAEFLYDCINDTIENVIPQGVD
jgi:hypothetical protein